VAEGTRLLSEYGGHTPSRVRIPPSPSPPGSLPSGPRAPVAQLDRASVYGTEGLGFESLRARFTFLLLITIFCRSSDQFPTGGDPRLRGRRRPISARSPCVRPRSPRATFQEVDDGVRPHAHSRAREHRGVVPLRTWREEGGGQAVITIANRHQRCPHPPPRFAATSPTPTARRLPGLRRGPRRCRCR
jgi:hypothetical protein